MKWRLFFESEAVLKYDLSRKWYRDRTYGEVATFIRFCRAKDAQVRFEPVCGMTAGRAVFEYFQALRRIYYRRCTRRDHRAQRERGDG
jgi:hypothetical protein